MGLLDFNLNSPRPVYSSLIPGVQVSLECPSLARVSRECPTPREPNPRMSPECPPGVPNPRVSWSAQPQSVPGVPSPRVSLECPTPVFLDCPTLECPRPRVSLEQSISTKRGWGRSKIIVVLLLRLLLLLLILLLLLLRLLLLLLLLLLRLLRHNVFPAEAGLQRAPRHLVGHQSCGPTPPQEKAQESKKLMTSACHAA